MDVWPCGRGRVAMKTRTCGSIDVMYMWPCGLVDVVMWTGDQEFDVAMALYRLMDHLVVSSLVGCGQRWPATATDIDDGHSINLHM